MASPKYKIRAEIAFTTQPLAATPIFQDVSSYLLAGAGKKVSISRGRPDQFGAVQPSRMSMTLDNSDGRFTAGLVTGALYPNVKKGKRVRISVRPWDYTNERPINAGNLLPNPGAEVDTTGWNNVSNATIARTTTAGQFNSGVAGFRMTTTGAGSMSMRTDLIQIVGGRQYAAGFKVKAAVANSRALDVMLQYYASDGTTLVGSFTGSNVTPGTGSFSTGVVTGLAPATAVYVRVLIEMTSGGAAAGEAFYVDDVILDEGNSAGTFTTSSPDTLYRFDGFIDQWPTEWSGIGGQYAEATVTASDRQARLGRSRVLKNIIEEAVTALSPIAYWPLVETSTDTYAASDSLNGPFTEVQFGSGGDITADATGPDTDGLSAPQFTPASASNGKYLRSALGVQAPTARGATDPWCVSFYFTATTDGGLLSVGQNDRAVLVVLSSGDVGATVYDALGNPSATTIVGSFGDGATHHVLVRYDGDLLWLYVDGVASSSANPAGAMASPNGKVIYLGAYSPEMADPSDINAFLLTGSISHLAFFDRDLDATQRASLANPRTQTACGGGESSSARVSRWATYLGLTSSIETGLSTSIQFRDWTGQTPWAMLEEVVRTEGGLLFFDTQGRLVFHSRGHRYSPTPALTLAAGEYEDVNFILDDSQLVNEAAITKAGGQTFTYRSATSQADYDVYAISETSITTVDNEAEALAQWRVNIGKDPINRAPGMTVDWGTFPAGVVSAGLLELGALVRLSGLPSQGPASTYDGFIEGYSETLALDEWRTKYNLSPASGYSAWTLDSSTLSQLDSSTKLAY